MQRDGSQNHRVNLRDSATEPIDREKTITRKVACIRRVLLAILDTSTAMSVITSRIQPPTNTALTTKINGHLLNNNNSDNGKVKGTIASLNTNGSSSLLKDMLATEMRFGEPVGKNTWDIGSGVREILPGPRSPKANGNALSMVNGNGNGKNQGKSEGEEEEEESEEEVEREDDRTMAGQTPKKTQNATSSSSTLIGPSLPPHLATPSRKGKEPASSSNLSSPSSTPRAGGSLTTRSLHEDPIDLSWPTHLRARNQSSAGLYNPSMACYANATLQVLLHTPPVLRIAQTHITDDCKLLYLNL